MANIQESASRDLIQISPAERQYYQDIHGFDPVTDRISLNELYLVYRYETWFPLPQDPALNAAGVEIGAQVDLDCDGLVHNHIVFQHKGKKAIVECTHTVVLSGPAQEVLGLAKDAFLSHNETLKAVALPQWGHFAALKSYVAGIAEVGLSHLLRSSLDADEMKEATFGFNSIMRRQILAALNEVAARPALALLCNFFMELVDEAPADWLSPRVELLSTMIPLEDGWTYIEKFAPQWIDINREKLEPFRRLVLLLRIFSKKFPTPVRLRLLREVPHRTLSEGIKFTTLELLEYLVGDGLGKGPITVRTCDPTAKEYQFRTEVAVGNQGWYAETDDDPHLVVQPWMGDDDGFYYSYGWRLKDVGTLQSFPAHKRFRIIIFIRHQFPVFPTGSSAPRVSMEDPGPLLRHFEMVGWMLSSSGTGLRGPAGEKEG